MSNQSRPRMGPAERRAALKARQTRRTFERSLLPSVTQSTSRNAALINPPLPLRVAAHLALARLVDGAPGVSAELRAGGVVLIEIADTILLREARAIWRAVLDLTDGDILYIGASTAEDHRAAYKAIGCVVMEPVKARDRDAIEIAMLRLMSWGLPTIAIAPSLKSCVPAALLDAARCTLALPPLDTTVIARTIQLVTGQRCPVGALAEVRLPVSCEHLAIAVRHDRSPTACIAELVRLQSGRGRDKSRAIALDDLHGLDEAVAWARSTITDLGAWRRGEIGWDQIDHGVVLDGPPGTGKTLFARSFADAAGLPLVSGSLGKWQAAGHLGDLLKAMRADFDKARSLLPCVLNLDEIDSVVDRNKVTHDHADYVVTVTNALLELIDGMEGRTGLIFIASSNNSGRCDPALLRSGRLNRIIRIRLPDTDTRVRMIRVRLGPDLPDADLLEVAAFTTGFSGADVEKLVSDARRIARQAGRTIVAADLMAALAGDDPTSSPTRDRRTAVHEAGHGLAAVLLRGPETVVVSTRGRGEILGSTTMRIRDLAGTAEELEEELVIMLAGRAAEQVLLGSVGAGGGGSSGSDLHSATMLAAAMVGSFGLAGPHPHLYVAAATQTEEIVANDQLRRAAIEILDRAGGRATGLIRAHRSVMRHMVERLVAHRRLDGAEIAMLLVDQDGAEITLGRSA